MSFGLLGDAMRIPPPIKRNVFISYYHGDRDEVNDFIDDFCFTERLFTPYMLADGESYGGNAILSDDPTYVMQQIRSRHVSPTTVTIVLLGHCTHSRKYIDWEAKSSLQQGGIGGESPNGLIGIGLPSVGNHCHIPERLKSNVDSGYARTYTYPSSGADLQAMIETAFQSRSSSTSSILNPQDMWGRNRVCEICGVTH
jgi:hypothetical protein